MINYASGVRFWTSFLRLVWWNTKRNENLILNPSHILNSWHERTRHWRILNYCLLFAKYYIVIVKKLLHLHGLFYLFYFISASCLNILYLRCLVNTPFHVISVCKLLSKVAYKPTNQLDWRKALILYSY